jgi:hypothetical protein
MSVQDVALILNRGHNIKGHRASVDITINELTKARDTVILELRNAFADMNISNWHESFMLFIIESYVPY